MTFKRSLAAVSLAAIAAIPATAWPASVFAPYVDMTLYPTADLGAISQASTAKYFNLAFVVADPTNVPAWGGYASYDVTAGNAFQQTVMTGVNAVRAAGGDVAVSFGGSSGQELAQTITNVPSLTAAYQQVISACNVTRVDFDVEGAAVADHASIDRRSQAIAALQQSAAAAGKSLQVVLTLPVLPTGLDNNGLYVVQSAKTYGVKLTGVNVMAMDYGDSAAPNPAGNMGSYAIQAGTSLYNQLTTLYGNTLTSAQRWAMVGVTPMIGVNDQTDEVFTVSDAQQVEAWATQHGIGELAFWSANRDHPGSQSYVSLTNSGLNQADYAFSKTFEPFTTAETPEPTMACLVVAPLLMTRRRRN